MEKSKITAIAIDIPNYPLTPTLYSTLASPSPELSAFSEGGSSSSSIVVVDILSSESTETYSDRDIYTLLFTSYC